MPRKAKRPETASVNLRLPVSLVTALKRAAQEERRSLTNFCELLIERALREREARAKAEDAA